MLNLLLLVLLQYLVRELRVALGCSLIHSEVFALIHGESLVLLTLELFILELHFLTVLLAQLDF